MTNVLGMAPLNFGTRAPNFSPSIVCLHDTIFLDINGPILRLSTPETGNGTLKSLSKSMLCQRLKYFWAECSCTSAFFKMADVRKACAILWYQFTK